MAKINKVKRIKNRGDFINRSLQRQILIPFLTLIIVSVMIISYTNFTVSKDTLISEKVTSIEGQMENLNDTFDTFFTNKENVLNRFSQNNLILNYQEDEYNELIDYLSETVDADDVIINMYRVEDKAGKTIIYPEADFTDVDGTTREWYQASVEAEGEVVWSEPYIDMTTDQMVITASQAFYQNGQLAGAYGADILVDSLIDITGKIKTSESGYTMIVSQNDNIILHPNEALLGTSLTDQSYYHDIQANGDSGIIEFKEDNDKAFLGYTTNPITGWFIAEAAFEKDFDKIGNSMIVPMLITLAIIIILAIIVSVILAKRITNPIQQLQKVMKEVENGNLLAKANVRVVNEIGELAKSFNHMINQVRGTMVKVKSVAINVSGASQTLVASAEENSASSNEVATTMEQIASGAVEQAEMMESNATATEQLSSLIAEIESHHKHVNDAANVMNDVSKSGSKTVDVLYNQSEETGKITREVVHAIQSLDQKSANISNIVTQITDIASQTNLLALNAAIEAARAGEHGRGFAIVADEVRILAEQTENSLADISTLIKEIQTETQHSVALIKKTDEVIHSQTDIVNDTSKAFSSIQETIEKNNQLINKAMTAMEAVVNQEQIISVNTENIAAISEETAAGTEEVAASVEQQTASMEQLNYLAGELEIYSQEMQDEVSIFIIEETKQ